MNDELISRKALADKLKLAVIITDDLYGMGIMAGIEHAKECVEEAPTIDAVPVVRCKDCFYSRPRNRGECEYLIKDVVICENCEMLDFGWNPMFGNDFCSYGKRKDGDE